MMGLLSQAVRKAATIAILLRFRMASRENIAAHLALRQDRAGILQHSKTHRATQSDPFDSSHCQVPCDPPWKSSKNKVHCDVIN
jgi:hypothetical protein